MEMVYPWVTIWISLIDVIYFKILLIVAYQENLRQGLVSFGVERCGAVVKSRTRDRAW